jgi:hypothetical protein
MLSWWRRIKISAVFHVSPRWDSRSHAATRVIRRKTNHRHMIGDHHGQTLGEQLSWSEPWTRFSARTAEGEITCAQRAPGEGVLNAGGLPVAVARATMVNGIRRRFAC